MVLSVAAAAIGLELDVAASFLLAVASACLWRGADSWKPHRVASQMGLCTQTLVNPLLVCMSMQFEVSHMVSPARLCAELVHSDTGQPLPR